jgi:glycine/D-amino acid oxidase-like deaminating enzyme
MALAPGLHAGMGYNGRDVAMATMMGKQLAMTVTGKQPDMPVESMSRIPLHQLRQAAPPSGSSSPSSSSSARS